ncbi:phage tail protein [Sphingomonas sp. QA11]|uniref:phage tail protein n=1 Tax=Sphingomonas sp. QA11 TaxID=2950605 RepID=UPI00234BE79C|nr:phage tail protein [Sphingomonas sp. QA11]WCM29207.1 phage tail protein [Sphingomonas sp. QA11]
MMMSLGMFAFALSTLAFEELQRRTDYRHVRSPRIGARDAAQFVGPGDETISLSGTAHAELSDGAASLDQLREMAGQGYAWPLVDGAGRVYGAFVIEGVDERQKHFLPDGTPLKIEFAIDLLLVEDEAGRNGQ